MGAVEGGDAEVGDGAWTGPSPSSRSARAATAYGRMVGTGDSTTDDEEDPHPPEQPRTEQQEERQDQQQPGKGLLQPPHPRQKKRTAARGHNGSG